MQPSIDRRAFRRFRLEVPILFRWDERYEAGKSANVGLGGMFIFASKCPPLNYQIEVEFSIPAHDRKPRQLRFCCKGRVIRVESCGAIAGFAVAGPIEGELAGEGQQLVDDIELLAGLSMRQ